jgi:hypothetical protein
MESADEYDFFGIWSRKRHEQEETVFELKQKHGYSYKKVASECRNFNLSVSEIGAAYRRALKRKVLEQRRAGLPHEEIAEKFKTPLRKVKIICFPSDLYREEHKKENPRQYPEFSWLPLLVCYRREIEQLLEDMNERHHRLRNAVHERRTGTEEAARCDAGPGL